MSSALGTIQIRINANPRVDYSLISAGHAESIAEMFRTEPDTNNPYSQALADRPEAFTEARNYCFEGYRASGAEDVRLLGPCLVSAVGGDYFRMLPVP
jgi:hypothetical protein